MKIMNSVLDVVGQTPMIALSKSVPNNGHRFLAKVEYFNPGGSVKDRIAQAIIEDAERKGQLKPGGTIIEATSGNTGVALAMVAAIKGYKCIFVMPDKISEEKRATLRAYGARVVITPTGVEPDDPRSFYSVAKKFVETTPNSFYANQYHNPANPAVHYATTGPEIWEQTDGKIDVFVGGAGTGGTLSGAGRYLKEKNPNIKIVCADPYGSILHDLFYYKEVRTKPSSYLVEGIGEDMIPENVHFNVFDDFVQIGDPETFQLTRKIAQAEGLLVGPSCGAALVAAIKYSEGGKLKKPSTIVTLFPDGGRSYLSKVYNEDWMLEKNLVESVLSKFVVADYLNSDRNRKNEKNGSGDEVGTIDVKASVSEAAERMAAQRLSHLSAYSGEELLGYVEASDLLSSLAAGKISARESILHFVRSSTPEVESTDSLASVEIMLKSVPFVRVRGTNRLIGRSELGAFVASR